MVAMVRCFCSFQTASVSKMSNRSNGCILANFLLLVIFKCFRLRMDLQLPWIPRLELAITSSEPVPH